MSRWSNILGFRTVQDSCDGVFYRVPHVHTGEYEIIPLTAPHPDHDLYADAAQLFGTTREEAKLRILRVAWGLPPVEDAIADE